MTPLEHIEAAEKALESVDPPEQFEDPGPYISTHLRIAELRIALARLEHDQKAPGAPVGGL